MIFEAEFIYLCNMILTILIALALGSVIEIKPESNPDGKILTMTEATIDRSVYPVFPRLDMPDYQEPFYKLAEKGIYYLEEGDTVWVALNLPPNIHCGISVSRNEFGINGGLFPSPDGERLAFYSIDESLVPEFPLLDIKTAGLRPLKYPMNGTASERVRLVVFDKALYKNTTLKINDFGPDRYITAVSWMGSDKVLTQVLDRSQHDMHLNLYDAKSGELIKTILKEHNDAWVEPYDPQYQISDEFFLYFTDNRDGYKSIYLVDLDGGIKRLTPAPADAQFIKYQAGYIYYYSAEVSPAERHLFRVKLTPGKTALKSKIGKPERITKQRGWHTVLIKEDRITDHYSSFSQPGFVQNYNSKCKPVGAPQAVDDPLTDYAVPTIEFGTVPSADGQFENHYRLYKPLGFDPSKKYPLIVYVYGGPHSQMVKDSWLGDVRMWELLIAQKGYVVYVQDNRGTSNHGAAYEKAINRQCGQAEMADQMVGINALLEQPWIDRERVGVHGWSYGGFMTISLALTYPDIFKVAVAGGPVIDWSWYEVMYGERYMDTEATNPDGFALTRLQDKADKLQAKLLICQGANDVTVVWQHSLSFVQACINADKQVDYFPFPTADHNMRGEERVYLYQKITDYFDTNL